MDAERALLDPGGIPGRPWYRHQVYAPKFTYAPEVLPGPAEAIADGDDARLSRDARACGGHRPGGRRRRGNGCSGRQMTAVRAECGTLRQLDQFGAGSE